MSVKPLWTAQAIADDQTSVYSTLYDLLALWGIGSDELEDYEITGFGANKFLITIIFVVSLMRLTSQIVLKTSMGHRMKTYRASIGESLLSPIVKRRIKPVFAKTSSALFTVLVDGWRSKFQSKSVKVLLGISQLVSQLPYRERTIKNIVKLATVSLAYRQRPTKEYVSSIYVLKTLNFRAWYNTVEVEQEI